ncbi:MAG TPA: peptidoglycan-binding domain-containing protein [Dongiaceae bacterium]
MAYGTPTWTSRTAAVAALLLAGVLTCAWVFYADDRLPSHSARIGTLAVDLPEGSGTGTAFLVNECGILTNFHVVFGPWYVTALRPPSHAFVGTFTLTEVTQPDGTHPRARATPVIWGDYLGADRQLRVPENDWVYLTLDRCLGKTYGFFDLRDADAPVPVDHGFTAIGYSSGRQMEDPDCAARANLAAGAKGWLHDCALLPGDSGGPIFRGGTLSVVALASGYRAISGDSGCIPAGADAADDPVLAWGGGCANIAVPMSSAIRDRICTAGIAVGLQTLLARAGYEVGPIGTIEAPQLAEAIRQVERRLHWPQTGQPDWDLYKVLQVRLALGS